jgi:general secretion pathway protein F
MLISVGIPIIDAVKLASAVAHNLKFGEIAGKLENMIRAGVPVAKTFRSDPIFPAMVVEMAASGEQAGELSKMLNKGVDLIDKDIDASIGGLLAKLEPLLTVVMGVIVGLILIGAYLPMFDYMRHLE